MMLPSSIAHVFPTSLGSFFIPIVSTAHPIISCSVLPWPFLDCDFYFVDVSSGAAPSASAPTPLTEDYWRLREGSRGGRRGTVRASAQAPKSHVAFCDGDRWTRHQGL